MKDQFDLSSTFVHIDDAGNATPIKLAPAFWRDTSFKYDRLVGTFEFRSDDDLHSSMQEMHPEADELLFLVSGAIDVIIDKSGSEQVVSLEAGQAALVPRDLWHRLVMRRPGKLLFINSRTGMRSRSVR